MSCRQDDLKSQASLLAIKFKRSNAFWKLMLDGVEAGPFDGGCLVYAQALQALFGGEIIVLVGKTHFQQHAAPDDEDEAQHAVVRVGAVYLDFNGPTTLNTMIKRFQSAEKVVISSVRTLQPTDLSDAPRSPATVDQIVALATQALAHLRQEQVEDNEL